VSLKVHSKRSVDVVVVDTPRAAGVALATPRTDAESTHVLCRHADETPSEFGARVQRRLERIRLTRCVRSLWYVVGSDVTTSADALPLLGTLLPLLDAEATLTVVGPGSRQGVLFAGIDSVLQGRPDNLTVRAELYADGERTAPRSGLRARAASSGSRTGHHGRHGGWFPVDAGNHAPESVRTYAS
jgi:hypothetical protein